MKNIPAMPIMPERYPRALHRSPDKTKRESIAHEFMRACHGYVPTAKNYDTLAKTLAINALPAGQLNGTTDEIVAHLIDGGFWTAPNLIACFHALNRDGLLDSSPTTEPVRVSRVTQHEALRQYLRCVLDAAMLALVERVHRGDRERRARA
jgi:hypothetical protein